MHLTHEIKNLNGAPWCTLIGVHADTFDNTSHEFMQERLGQVPGER
jgi:hypothetical protein